MTEPVPAATSWLDHLGPLDYGRQLESVCRAELDTIWVDSDPRYGRWRWRPSPRVLWITGPPACGKSVLARHLIESEKALDETLTLCYYLFPSNATIGTRSKVDMACQSLLGQILMADPDTANSLPPFDSIAGGAYEHLLFVLSNHNADSSTPVEERKSVIIILDGLDEAVDNEATRLQRLFAATIATDRRYELKLLVTCRFIHPFHEPREDDVAGFVIRMEEHREQIDRCLGRYLGRRLAELGVFDPDEANMTRLLRALEGSFLAAAGLCTLVAISGMEEDATMFDRLYEMTRNLPESLLQAYNSALGPKEASNTDLVMSILTMLAVAVRPLKAKEILDAVSNDPSKPLIGDIHDSANQDARLLGLCQGLIAFDGTGYMLISGFCVLDYVIESNKLANPRHGVAGVMNGTMAKLCIRQIVLSAYSWRPLNDQMPSEETQMQLLDDHPFLAYAATNWARHSDNPEFLTSPALLEGKSPKTNSRVQDSLDVIIILCNTATREFLTWFPVFWKETRSSTPLTEHYTFGMTQLMVSAYVNLPAAVDRTLDPDRGVIQTSLVASAPLIKFGYMARADRQGQTALHIAAAAGHIKVIGALAGHCRTQRWERLVVNRKDVNGQTPLHYAVKNNQKGAVVALMESSGIDLNAQDSRGRTALHYAAQIGDDGMVWGLLDANATVDIEDSLDKTPSLYAKEALASLERGQGNVEDLATKYSEFSAVVHLLEKAEMAGIWLSDFPLPARKAVDNLFDIESVVFTPDFSSKQYAKYPTWDFLRNEVTEWSKAHRRGLRWLHIPANNMTWIEILIKKLEPHRLKMGTRERILRKELWANCQHRGSPGYYHATFMIPQCRKLQIDQEGFCLYMPYIHWETMETMLKMSLTIDMIRKHQTQENEEPTRDQRQEVLLYHYLDRPNPLHIRRTLDQYRYYNLEDTTARDKDQLFCRVFSQDPPNNRPVLMVDQLWLWRLPDGTIITNFPARWSLDGSKSSGQDDLDRYDRTDVFKNIKRKLHYVKSSNDLISLVVGECFKAYYDPTRQAGTFPNILEIYSNEIGRITDVEARLLNTFTQNVKNLTNATPRKEAVDIVDPVVEMEMLREIKDIMDELQTMREIFTDQKIVLEDLLELLDDPDTGVDGISQDELAVLVDSRRGEVKLMMSQARVASQALNDLIDLKQKFSNVLEARWARNMAEETSRQGTTILVFTIVTIVFLPLSFMAAFFALDISQFPKMQDGGLDLDFVSTYIFSMSAAVVVPLLLIAFNVDWVTRLRDSTKASILDRSEIVAKEDAHFKNVTDRVQKRKETMKERLRKLRAAESDVKGNQSRKPSLPFTTLLRYLLVILPIGEVRFACWVMVNGARTLHLNKSSNGSHGLLPDDDDDSSIEGVDLEEDEGQKRWILRSGIRRSWITLLLIVRLLFLPLWVSVLCVEFVFGAVVYGLLWLVLETNPLKTLVDEVRHSTLLSLYEITG
ncbi:hypothetical protein V8F33_003815 [Rhypophila sp. PSN 637]